MSSISCTTLVSPRRLKLGKRIFDICFSLLALTLGAPIFFFIALLIFVTSRGPIFFSSLRVGLNNEPIRCYKFRTMHPHADLLLKKLLNSDPKLRKEWSESWKLKNDPRVTKIGKWLRKTSLDELPQFWNVLKGDLSIVGPRPVTEEEIRKFFGSKRTKLLSIRPGLTGLWQTSGRNALSFDERIALDEHYIDTQSLFLDLRLICKTIPVMLSMKGAY
jgi:exopolysaccharide production protein ExoY